MNKIKVTRSLHIEQPGILEEAAVVSVGYVAGGRSVLVESVVYGLQREYYFRARDIRETGYKPTGPAIRRSEDNGLTWKPVETWVRYSPLEGKRRLQKNPPQTYLHPRKNSLLRLYFSNEDIEGMLPWDPESPTGKTGRLFTQVSTDAGATWSAPRQLVIGGPEFDETHWGPEIWYGRNFGYPEGVGLLYMNDRRFVLPFAADIPDEKSGNMISKSSCLIGTWRDDGWVDWEMSAYATVPEPFSVQGGCESSIALLNDGTLIMTMRVLVHQETAPPGISGTRYVVTSRDEGKTWSVPAPLRFEDGQILNTPACMGQIFRSGKNNHLYLIDNILDGPVFCHDPRYPLRIVEIDETTLRLKRGTLTTIETRDESQNQPETIRFSNWAKYEDRQTKNLILFITGCPGNDGRHEVCGVPPHSYRYEIEFPVE
jgi:hypothetical protein